MSGKHIECVSGTLCRLYATGFCLQSYLEHQDQLFGYFLTSSNILQLLGLDLAFTMSVSRCECLLNTFSNPAEDLKANSSNLSLQTVS